MLTKEIRKNIMLSLLGNPDIEAQTIVESEDIFEFQIRAQAIIQRLLDVKNVKDITITDPDSEIALIWSIEDVQCEYVRPDLSDEQALKVLQIARNKHDATVGVSWETLECWADELFPKRMSGVQKPGHIFKKTFKRKRLQ
jgi:hypothetical protein